MVDATSVYDTAVAAAESAFVVSTTPINQAHTAAVTALLAAYQTNLQQSASTSNTDLQPALTTHTTDVSAANGTYNLAVAGFQQTKNNADAASSLVYQQKIQSATNDYNSAANSYWMSFTGAMAGMMGMGDPSILYNAAKQYAVDVAFAGVAKTAADGASTVAFVTSERPADTTRDRGINTADNTLAVAREPTRAKRRLCGMLITRQITCDNWRPKTPPIRS